MYGVTGIPESRQCEGVWRDKWPNRDWISRRILGEGSGHARWEGLNADLLLEVFFHLPYKDLFEVMLVSRDWNKAVIEGSNLWREVEIVSTWDSRGLDGEGMEAREGREGVNEKVPELLSQVLRESEVVRISGSTSYGVQQNVLLGCEYVSGKKQDTYTLHISASFFPLLLAKCPNLKSLEVDGKLLVDGTCARICHPGLETLKFAGWSRFSLILDCPLLDLSFGWETFRLIDLYDISNKEDRSLYRLFPPFLNCPSLTSLNLSNCHSFERILEFMAAHAPDIIRLQAHLNDVTPFRSLSHFKALRDLSLVEYVDSIDSNEISEFKNLERLELNGIGVAALEVALTKLRTLIVNEYDEVVEDISYTLVAPYLSI